MAVDILFGDYSWLEEALVHPQYDLAGYPVLDLPYLVLMKAESSRGRDFGDLTTMLGLASEKELDRVRAVVKRYAPDTTEDVESLIYLGQFEMKPPAEE